MIQKKKEVDSNSSCAKIRLKPWLVGLVALIVIVVAWIVLGGARNRETPLWEDRAFLGKANLPSAGKMGGEPNRVVTVKTEYSYHHIVEAVNPAVVGISLPSAGLFFQRWGAVETQMPDLAWRSCARCGWVIIDHPENPSVATLCPNCGNIIGERPVWTEFPQQPQGQMQAWGAGPQRIGPSPLTMFCPNCGTEVTRQPGVPWASINCPNCGSIMFCPRLPASQLPQGQMQAWGGGPQGFSASPLTMFCLNCGTKVTRQPGVPWASINCPNCGSLMSCPRFPTNSILGQQQVWVQPTLEQVPAPTMGNVPLPSTGREVAMPGFQGLGSGVIISQRGYILTNSHLVSGRSFVTVTLFTPQGQKNFEGKVVALASDRDLAIVKIEPQNIDLSVAPIGNSDIVQIGDTVLAFGNPFGLSQTVTSGIISAMRASTVIEGHQLNNLIQTDAPINQGNSGGPLVNLQGEVIGINTAIYSPAQTHTGLGFAVPINQAKEVFNSYMDESIQKADMRLLGYPAVRAYPAAVQKTEPNAGMLEDSPSWLGINIQILNDVLSEQLNLPVDRGLLINEVYVNSPAAEAGLRRGDVIIRFDGKRITDETRIRILLAEKKPGDKVKLTIIRGRKRLDVKFKTAGGSWWQGQPAAIQNKGTTLLKNAEIETGSAEIVSLGISAVTITPEVAFAYDLPKDTTGVIATETEGLALNCGVRDGDIINKVNNEPTPDLISFLRTIENGDLSQGLTFSLIRQGVPVEVIIKDQPGLLPRGL